MRMDKLTTKFKTAISDAQSLAVGKDHQFIEPAHLLTAMLRQQGGSVRPLLQKAGVNVNQLEIKLDDFLTRQASVSGNAGEVHLSGDLAKMLSD